MYRTQLNELRKITCELWLLSLPLAITRADKDVGHTWCNNGLHTRSITGTQVSSDSVAYTHHHFTANSHLRADVLHEVGQQVTEPYTHSGDSLN